MLLFLDEFENQITNLEEVSIKMRENMDRLKL